MTGYETGRAINQEEPGSMDNTLSINPTDERFAPTVSQWQDGGVYKGVTVDLRQISPGKFEVTALSGGTPESGSEEQPTEETAEQPTAPAAPAAPAGMNPAVARMMDEDQKA